MELELSLQKAELLLRQEKYGEAQTEAKSYLASNPESIHALIILVQTHLGMKEDEKADRIVDEIIRKDPSDPHVLYLKGITQCRLGKRKSALKFIDNALAYDPMMVGAHGLKSLIYFDQARFEDSLQSANQGLTIDPEDETCLNQRSRALLKLDRKEDHLEAGRQALKSNPMNSNTHATVGYSELEKGNSLMAKEHFREALRLNPNNEYARQGMLHAIKATNLFYRLFLKYVFWMASMKPSFRWMVIVIGYLLIQALNNYADQLGVFQPIAEVVIVLYMIFAISTWILGPVSNIFLRFHSFGKYVLNEQEVKVASLCATLLGASLIGAVLFVGMGDDALQWQNVGLYLLCSGIAMTVIVSSIENASLEKSRRNLKKVGVVFAVGVGLLILSGVLLPVLAVKMFNWLVYGFVGYQFYANTQE